MQVLTTTRATHSPYTTVTHHTGYKTNNTNRVCVCVSVRVCVSHAPRCSTTPSGCQCPVTNTNQTSTTVTHRNHDDRTRHALTHTLSISIRHSYLIQKSDDTQAQISTWYFCQPTIPEATIFNCKKNKLTLAAVVNYKIVPDNSAKTL